MLGYFQSPYMSGAMCFQIVRPVITHSGDTIINRYLVRLCGLLYFKGFKLAICVSQINPSRCAVFRETYWSASNDEF